MGLANGTSYTLYVKCQDTVGNVNTADYTVSFSVASASGAGEPVYNPATDTLIWSDNMDAYVDATTMGALPSGGPERWVPNPSPLMTSQPVDTVHNVVISPGHGGTGKALRLVYDGAYQESHRWNSYQDPATSNTAEHVFQFWVRVTLSQPLGSYPIYFKWFEAWHGNYRVQWNTHNAASAHGSLATHSTMWQFYDGSGSTTTQGDQPVGPYPIDVWDGQWHRITHAYHPHTSSANKDGYVRMWVDGTKIIDVSQATVGVTPPGGQWAWSSQEDVDNIYTAVAITNLLIGSSQTASSSQAFTMDVDDFLWWTD